MKVRHKTNKHLAVGSNFNTHGLGEFIAYFDDGDASSEYIKDYDVLLEFGLPYYNENDKWWHHAENGDILGFWFDMKQAFKDKRLITDNENTSFREPKTQEEYDRGWYD